MIADTKPGRPVWAFVLLAAAVLFAVVVRVRLMSLPLERDEGEYAYCGQLLLQGVAPYAAAYTMKMPGASASYAAVMAVAGQTATAIRLGLLAVNLATVGLIFLLGRRLVDEATGALAAGVFALASISVGVMGFAAHATHFVVLFAAGGLVLLLRGIEEDRRWMLAAAGASFGIAVTMKQHGVVFPAFGAAWLAWSGARSASPSARATWGRLAAFLAGAAVPIAALFGALAAAGVFAKFWFWNVVYAREYATNVSVSMGLDRLREQLGLMRSLAGVAALAGLGLACLAWDDRSRRTAPFLIGLLVFSTMAVVPGLYFRHHYFIQMLPAISLLAGVAVTTAARRAGRLAAVAVLAIPVAWLVGIEHTYEFRMTPLEFCRTVYASNPFPEAVDVAAYVRANTLPSDRVAVLGSEPEIYFYSGRRAATGHIYMYGLMEEQPHALAMQKEMAAEIEAARPKFVVMVAVAYSWMRRSGSEAWLFPWIDSFLAAGYERVGLVEEIPGRPSKAYWGAAAMRKPQSDSHILVYRRKDGI
jgi:hypothetical protein